MPGKQAVAQRVEAAEHLLASAEALCGPIERALRSVYKPMPDIPQDMAKLAKRLQ